MIEKWLVESNQEETFKGLSVDKKLQYYKICNDIQKENGNFIIAADISVQDLCSVVKSHYDDDRLVIDDIITF